jgi:hypothetical protein
MKLTYFPMWLTIVVLLVYACKFLLKEGLRENDAEDERGLQYLLDPIGQNATEPS